MVGQRVSFHEKAQVRARRARGDAHGISQAQRALRLGQHRGRRAARQRGQRRLASRGRRPLAQAGAERAVGRAPVVAPARGAVSLVDGGEGDPGGLRRAAQGGAERPGVETLRGRQGQDAAARRELAQAAFRRLGLVAEEQGHARDPGLGQAPRLVEQQRAQGSHDQRRPRRQQRGQVEHQRLPRAGGQRQDEIAARQERGEPVGLTGAQLRGMEIPPRQRGQGGVVARKFRGLGRQLRGRRALDGAVRDPGRPAAGLAGSGPGDE